MSWDVLLIRTKTNRESMDEIKSENIIPNYFHPFVRENIVLRMMEPPAKEMILFRGDGDQDRPC